MKVPSMPHGLSSPTSQSQAVAASEGIRKIAEAIKKPGGKDSFNLRPTEQYIKEFGNLVKESVTLLISSPISEVCGMVGTLTGLIKRARMRQSELFIDKIGFCLLDIRNMSLSL
jgi:hypothetical protein